MRALGLVALLSLALVGCGSQAEELPGGDSGKGVLAAHHWLDGKDRVRFGESAPAADVQKAICTYLFGTPEEVGDTAGLDGKVTLHHDSGYRSAGGNGIGFECGYDVKGKTRFGMVLWSRDLGEMGKVSHPVTVQAARRAGRLRGVHPGLRRQGDVEAAATVVAEGGGRPSPGAPDLT